MEDEAAGGVRVYGVRFIDDDQLPEDHDFIMARTPDDTLFFVKRSKVTPQVLEQAWAAYRALPRVPEQDAPPPTRRALSVSVV